MRSVECGVRSRKSNTLSALRTPHSALKTMRLFVALDLSGEIRANVARLIERLRPAGREMKWVNPDSMHLTLKFLGHQPETKLEEISTALAVVPVSGPVSLDFRGLGFFPNERRPRVFWVGVEAPEALARLAQAIEQALAPLGIAAENRPFSPHLTLARLKEPRPMPRLIEELARLDTRAFGQMTATEFVLFESRLRPAGAQYTPLRMFPLG